MQIGGAIEPKAYRPYNPPKYSADYIFFTDLYWYAKAEITKEINLTEGGRLSLNQSKQLNATVKTKAGDGNFGAETNVNTGSGGTTTWRSSNPGVATISNSGLVQAVSRGTTTITVLWEKDGFTLTTTTNIGVEENPGDDGGNNNGGGGSCSPTIGPPSQGTTMTMSDLDPNANGVIKADNRSAEKFDVLQGIPTSESLYTNAFADNYLFKQAWVKMTGKTTYDCNVTISYAREWTESGPDICTEQGCTPGPPLPANDTVPVPYNFQITRDYSYWKINNLEVYKIAKATMKNYALPGETVTMMPSGYIPPTLESKNDEAVESHVKPGQTSAISYTPPKLTGGLNSPPNVPNDTSRLKGMAESNTPQSKVNNDLVKFNNTIIMNDAETTKDGPTPTNIPNPTTIGQDVLYKPNNMISNTLMNKENTTSSGEIHYEVIPGNVNGGSNKVLPINGINTVTVHTPVVNYAFVSDDQPHNQKTIPNTTRSALILERPFIVRIPTSGQHLEVASYPGYGNRDYAKYFRMKQVRFPFDVYNADRSQFIPTKTWVDIPVNQLDTPFYLPVWVDEGNYQVEFRNIAENAPATFTEQLDANTNLAHHVASDTVPVEVIGRLYDFHVTDISDYNWENVFRKQLGSSEPTGVSYWTGLNRIDGDPRGNLAPFILPIRPGSHPVQGFRNIAVKTGYHIKFDLKTKGNMFGKQDGVRITPTFYFVSKDGSSRQEVDLYYHRGQERLIRIGAAEDLEKRFVVLNSRLRNVPGTELGDTARYQYTYELTAEEQTQTTLADYMVRLVDQTSHQKTWVGRYNWMILSAPIRTLIGPKTNIPSGVNVDRANAAIQRWYGEYSLPANVYAVPKGTDLEPLARQNQLDEKAAVFLKNGYIVVNFNLETLRNGNTDAPHLQYIHAPLMNQWQMEGFSNIPADSQGKTWPVQDGDVVFYHADQSSRNDFQSQVPH
ncbi:Ig-like domain-containing protein [Paenibacillus pabuli]